MISLQAIAPDMTRSQGKDLQISYGLYSTSFGHCLIATIADHICHLSFFDDAIHSHEPLQFIFLNSRMMPDQEVMNIVV